MRVMAGKLVEANEAIGIVADTCGMEDEVDGVEWSEIVAGIGSGDATGRVCPSDALSAALNSRSSWASISHSL